MPIQASRDDWRKAIECAQRSGQVPEAIAEAALASLDACDEPIDAEVVGSWRALPSETCERFLQLARAIENPAASPARMTTPTLQEPEPDTDKTISPAEYAAKAAASLPRRREEDVAKVPDKLGRYLIKE